MEFLVLLCLTQVLGTPLDSLKHVQALRSQTSSMFDHAFDSYLHHGFPGDMLRPVTCKPRYRAPEKLNVKNESPEYDYEEFVLGNFSMTLIDSLDSLIVFNRTQDFITYAQYIIANVNFDKDETVSLFEDGLLTLAEDLGRRLLPAFNTSTGLPHPHVNLRKGVQKEPSTTITVAEAGSLVLEFTLLSYLTNDFIYRDTVQTTMKVIAAANNEEFMTATTLNVHTGKWVNRYMTIGASQDSYYEYLFKAYVALGCTDCLILFNKAYESVRKFMTFDGWILEVNIDKKTVNSFLLSSLAAFWPGLEVSMGQIESAVELHYLFYSIWAHYSALPDMFNLFDGSLTLYGRNYPLRPELIESTYYLYQATHHPLYLSIAEKFMQDINKYSRTNCGFAGLADVSRTGELIDNMESFFLSETLKYLFLTFREAEDFYYKEAKSQLDFLCSDQCCQVKKFKDLLNYEKFVFSTEGHFIPVLSDSHLISLGLNVAVPSVYATCPSPNPVTVSRLIELNLRKIYEGHGLQNRTQAFKVPQRPHVFEDFLTYVVTDEALMLIRMLVINDTSVVEELLVSEANFGLVFPKKQTLTAKLVLAEPIGSCSTLQNKDQVKGKVRSSQFVLVIRGTCLFIQKAHHAQSAGALGMIVYDNNLIDSALLTMKGDEAYADVKLYSAFTSYKNGINLLYELYRNFILKTARPLSIAFTHQFG